MLTRLNIASTRETPEIDLNQSEGQFSIKGLSLPENAFEFYAPVIEWITSYLENPNAETQLKISLEYINSGSLKQIFRLFYLLEELADNNHPAKILWYFKEDDELMEQKGIEFQEFLEIPVELISF